MKNNTNIFINPDVVFEKIVNENLFFPTYYQTLGSELRNIHALLAMKHCWEHFEQKEEFEKILPVKEQMDVFFRNEEPATYYNNVKDMETLILAPKTIGEAVFIIQQEFKRTRRNMEANFEKFNNIDTNINVALHFNYFYVPIIYDFVLVDNFKEQHNMMKEFYSRGVHDVDHMVFLLLQEAIVKL